MAGGVTQMLCTCTSQMYLTLSIILSLLRSSGSEGSVAHSLPGLTIIWRADCREWSSMVRILIYYLSHPASLRAQFWGLYFCNFINDIPSCFSSDTRFDLFADEAKLYRKISSTDNQVALQNDLNALNNWSKTWDIGNAKKCVVLQVKTRKRHHVPGVYYKLGNHSFLSVARENDLGIMVTNILN